MSDETQFIAETRQWLEQHCPPSLRGVTLPSELRIWGGRQETFPDADARRWFEAMRDKGWLAPAWPRAYGGGGLSAAEARALQRLMQQLGCPPPMMSLGIHMMGPTIMEFGNEEQKARLLPPIARGEIRWCQGYSEPGAGSDLASLQCRAVADGDDFIVSGQKVWTSFANKSDFLFCLVRTDVNAPKHQGISVLLIDMASPGVSSRPIELIGGSSHFCEVFLDQVRVPGANLLGELNHGWAIAKRMLQHERNMMGQGDLGEPFDPDMVAWARHYLGSEGDGRLANAVLRDRLVANRMQLHAVQATSDRVVAEMKAGGNGAASSVLKCAATLALQDKFELLLAIMGNRALGWQAGDGFTEEEIRATREWAFSKVQTIGGGTTEIQYNIIAKQILGLPD
ncbi:MAG TPA: acyl-CoA dehydrogenase family protein [Pseudomonadales bacterium]